MLAEKRQRYSLCACLVGALIMLFTRAPRKTTGPQAKGRNSFDRKVALEKT
jgi:hypothetical protein